LPNGRSFGAGLPLRARLTSERLPRRPCPQAAVTLAVALTPLLAFAALNVGHGLLCKGGSWLRLLAASAALAQVRLWWWGGVVP
jgi:hypothetical protein